MVDDAAGVAAGVAEAQLQLRIVRLEQELQNAKRALDELKGGTDGRNVLGTEGDKNEAVNKIKGYSRIRSLSFDGGLTIQRPAPKKGYLFKWNDRSIGWTGTKWALRFVTLEGGRLSYFGSHDTAATSAPRYVLGLTGCAVRDDGWKRNQRHASYKNKGSPPPPLDETGAYFFIFSVYQRTEDSDDLTMKSTTTTAIELDDSEASDSDITPLLRFSTPSLAEKLQWIQLIAESCAYCETDAYFEEEETRAAEERLRQKQKDTMAMTMPEAKEGTLPPLIFAPTTKISRRPSISAKNNSSPPKKLSFRTRSKENLRAIGDDQEVAKRQRKGYPPSKPMHRCAAPSFLSADAPAQNYRGFFNLGTVVLILSNVRLLLDAINKNGFAVTHLMTRLFSSTVGAFPEKVRRKNPWEDFPIQTGVLFQFTFVLIAYGIEKRLSKRKMSEKIGMFLHYANAHFALLISGWVVWTVLENPFWRSAFLFGATITWMKLISYAHTNQDYRSMVDNHEDQHQLVNFIENVDAKDANIVYPENLTLRNLLYFWCAPSLTYQIAFPRYPRIRWLRVFNLCLQLAGLLALFMFLVAQFVTPNLKHLIADMHETNGVITLNHIAQYGLKLSITNTYLWLLMFYIYFHLFLNLCAELLRFGDRVFYKDWWNSAEVSAYWRLWNMPVHYWLIRHLYFPCLRHNMSRNMATFMVFFLSAIMHEVLVSVPFHIIRPWSFIGMMMQMPLVAFTKFLYQKFPGSSIGNIIFWLSFCVVGQPAAILLYTVDYQYAHDFHNVTTTAAFTAGLEETMRLDPATTCLAEGLLEGESCQAFS